MQLLMINAEALRHRLHRLPRTVGEQTTHVQLALDPLIRTPDNTPSIYVVNSVSWTNPLGLSRVTP